MTTFLTEGQAAACAIVYPERLASEPHSGPQDGVGLRKVAICIVVPMGANPP